MSLLPAWRPADRERTAQTARGLTTSTRACACCSPASWRSRGAHGSWAQGTRTQPIISWASQQRGLAPDTRGRFKHPVELAPLDVLGEVPEGALWAERELREGHVAASFVDTPLEIIDAFQLREL